MKRQVNVLKRIRKKIQQFKEKDPRKNKTKNSYEYYHRCFTPSHRKTAGSTKHLFGVSKHQTDNLKNQSLDLFEERADPFQSTEYNNVELELSKTDKFMRSPQDTVQFDFFETEYNNGFN